MSTKTTKVFVGNLSFKTNQDDLKRAFEAIGKVTNANIITRGTRSLGYGFVEFASEDDANKAVGEMNKKKVDEREINVEIAKPRDETKALPRSGPVRRGGYRGGRGGGYIRRGGYRGGMRGGYRGGMRGGYRRGGPPLRRPPVNIEGRSQSTTTLFVANLPYNLDDTGLANVFSGLSIKTSHVVRRPNGRSKGFGFVEFGTEDDQKKGLAGEKKNVEGRDLVIKVALTDDSKSEEKKDVPVTTSITTTTTTPTTPITTTAPPVVNKTPVPTTPPVATTVPVTKAKDSKK